MAQPHRLDLRKGVLLERELPNMMIRGEIGASEYAYPNGLLSQRIARRIARACRRLLRRPSRSAT
jgi:hypothetical protein